jgi:D-methionine transport system substrate-binding protein
MRTFPKVLAGLVAASLALTACGGSDDSTDAAADPNAPLKVGASPVPHAEILNYIRDELAEAEGLKLEVVEFTDYIQPNVALEDGQIDANYFQTVPYLEEQKRSRGYDFTALEGVHIEPLGIYSSSVTSLEAVPQGAVVAIPNDPTNAGRALRLLAANNLITLKDTGDNAPTALDIEGNPRDFDIKEIDAAQLPRSLDDTGISVINGNYAIESGLTPAEDALALESGEGNPNSNLLVVRTGDEDDPRVQKLEKLLHSDEVKKFIEDKYAGAVLPAF